MSNEGENIETQGKAKAFAEVYAYFQALVAAKEAAPGDDLLGRLVVEHERRGHLDHDTLVNIAVILLMAGFESTATTIALGIATLFHHPDQLASFRRDPGLTDNAVEEILRYHTIGDSDALRVAVVDTDVGGQKIAAGEAVVPLIWSANRDETVFDRPDDFDISRDGRGQLAFGYGIHQCLGLNLARIELRIALRTLFDRIATLRLAVPVDALPFRYGSEVFGLRALPIAW